MYALIAAPAFWSTWIDGTAWKSALSELGVGLNCTMPTPPAFFTARLLSTRALLPRSQSTILPATLAGSSCGGLLTHCAAASSVLPAAPLVRASTIGAVTATGPVPAPWKAWPSPSVTVLVADRSWVPAATVVVHGMPLSTVDAPGPELPAEAATNTPALAALRNASSTALKSSTLSPIE